MTRPDLGLQAGHLDADNSARRDVLEWLQRAPRDIERQPVHGHPASDANSDRRNFLTADPHTREPFAAMALPRLARCRCE